MKAVAFGDDFWNWGWLAGVESKVMWVVLRSIALTSVAFVSMVLFLGQGRAISHLLFSGIKYPFSGDMELAIGCGLILAMAAFCLMRDMLCRGIASRSWQKKNNARRG